MSDTEELRQSILGLATNPEALPQIIKGLSNPVTCIAAMRALRQMKTTVSHEVLLSFIQNGQRTPAEAEQLAETLDDSRHYAPLMAYCDQFPRCAFLVLQNAATSAEYAEFQAWRVTLPRPLITVCTIDDLRSMNEVWEMAAEYAGDMMIVGQAPDAIQGIPVVEKCQPDVVLVDHMMPHMSGMDALRRLRVVAPQASLILCCYLYHDRDKDRQSQEVWAQALERGGDGVIPYGPMSLKEKVSIIRAAYAQKHHAS